MYPTNITDRLLSNCVTVIHYFNSKNMKLLWNFNYSILLQIISIKPIVLDCNDPLNECLPSKQTIWTKESAYTITSIVNDVYL